MFSEFCWSLEAALDADYGRRGMAAFVGRDVNKLKAKGGKWKYMSEKEMLEIAAPFSPYRYVIDQNSREEKLTLCEEAYSCGTCGGWRT